jgi:hypothetical protein
MFGLVCQNVFGQSVDWIFKCCFENYLQLINIYNLIETFKVNNVLTWKKVSMGKEKVSDIISFINIHVYI